MTPKQREQEAFTESYRQRSEIDAETLNIYLVALPCHCGQGGCAGWAMVSRNADSIRLHGELYAPDMTPEETAIWDAALKAAEGEGQPTRREDA